MNQTCPICGSDNYTFYGDYHYDDNFKRINCKNCGRTPVLKPKKDFEMSCIYCGSKLEKTQDKDGYQISGMFKSKMQASQNQLQDG